MSEQFFDVRKLRRSPKMRARVSVWIGALKSGDFRRATGRLHRVDAKGDRFCCLGVARYLEGGEKGLARHGNASGDFLTAEFAQALGLTGGDNDGSQRRLAILNDDKHGSFKKIARKLEKAYEAALA